MNKRSKALEKAKGGKKDRYNGFGEGIGTAAMHPMARQHLKKNK